MDESSSLSDGFGVLRKQLGKITDERLSRGKVFPLDGVLGLVVLGLMCGQRSLSAINRFGECHEQVLSQLGLRRSPSVQTLSRLLRMVSVLEVREALMEFVREVMELRGEGVGVVSMDGKTVRGVRENGEQLRLLHLFSREGSVALDQVEIAHHHEEPRAAERWIRLVSSRFEGLEVLSGDALYANTNLAEAIVAEGKDYVIKLKNQPELLEDAQLAFSEPREPDLRLTTKRHGRLEQRAVWVSSKLAGYSTFPGLSNVIPSHRDAAVYVRPGSGFPPSRE